MKLQCFFLMSALIASLSQAQHIANTATKIKFNKQRKPLFEWLRDDKNKEFGKIAIILTTTNQPPFIRIGTVKHLTKENFQLIATGYSFYCNNIKKEKDICYGAFVINPNQPHFDAPRAQQICMQLRNAYIEKYILKEAITLDSSGAASDEIDDHVSRDKKSEKITMC